MNDQVLETGERDCLSESHRDYMIRFVEFENLRQQRVSDKFLRERFKPSVAKTEKACQSSLGRLQEAPVRL